MNDASQIVDKDSVVDDDVSSTDYERVAYRRQKDGDGEDENCRSLQKRQLLQRLLYAS